MKKVLVAGELNVDLVLQGYHDVPGARARKCWWTTSLMVLGSASAICAMGLARLGTRSPSWARSATTPGAAFCVGRHGRARASTSPAW